MASDDLDAALLFEGAPCGSLSTRPDGTIVAVNEAFLTMTGYTRADLVDHRRFVDLLSPGGRIYHETHYAPMLQMHGSAREIALDLVQADGDRRPVLVNSVLERAADGTPLVIRTAVFDATERRAYERELLRAKERAEASEARATLLARTLQQTFIPPTPPDIPGLDVAAIYRPAGAGDEIGGDFFDVFEIGPGDWAVAIGDVCGKGVDAAVVTALARHTIRASAVHRHRPSAILTTLNEVLLRNGSDRFCTVALLRLRQAGPAWTATVSCAGHPAPLLLRRGAEPATVGTYGSLLGVVVNPHLVDDEARLASGDSVVLYTDGVTEARREGDLFGDERLRATLARAGQPAKALAEELLEEIMRFQSGNPRDDIAAVVVRIP